MITTCACGCSCLLSGGFCWITVGICWDDHINSQEENWSARRQQTTKYKKINLTGEFNMLYVTSKYYLQYRMYKNFYQIYQRRRWVKGNIKHFTKLKGKDNYFSPSAFPQKNVLNTRTNINIKTLSTWRKIRMINRISIMFVCMYILWEHKQAGNMTKNNWQEFFEIRKNYKKY